MSVPESQACCLECRGETVEDIRQLRSIIGKHVYHKESEGAVALFAEKRQVETMASGKAYLDFILEQLSELEEITYRAMMGEYILYYRGRIVGGIYDDRFLVKPTKTAASMMPDAGRERPYDGAKEMLLVDNVDNRAFLRDLLDGMYAELPVPRKKR